MGLSAHEREQSHAGWALAIAGVLVMISVFIFGMLVQSIISGPMALANGQGEAVPMTGPQMNQAFLCAETEHIDDQLYCRTPDREHIREWLGQRPNITVTSIRLATPEQFAKKAGLDTPPTMEGVVLFLYYREREEER